MNIYLPHSYSLTLFCTSRLDACTIDTPHEGSLELPSLFSLSLSIFLSDAANDGERSRGDDDGWRTTSHFRGSWARVYTCTGDSGLSRFLSSQRIGQPCPIYIYARESREVRVDKTSREMQVDPGNWRNARWLSGWNNWRMQCRGTENRIWRYSSRDGKKWSGPTITINWSEISVGASLVYWIVTDAFYIVYIIMKAFR